MTKQEVLQGALALNSSDKKYTVTVEDDNIIIETKYRGTRVRESTFRCVAHIKDDKTYTESTYDFDGSIVELIYSKEVTTDVPYSCGG